MNEPIYFEIKPDELRRNMERARGHEVSPREFEQTLREAGFTQLGTSWYCDRSKLNALDDAEIFRKR